ncbi:MAG: VOC family protein [Acidimicrobiia bacterium]|nr:VOC family protein [Acidimicrobiia bacterium]MDQ3501440.1 VOC family protein [Actinomycetota bacterium]
MPENPAIVAFRFPDLAEARKFYVDQLGFTVARETDEHENMSVRFGGAQMMLEVDRANFFGDTYNQSIAARRGNPGPNSIYIEADDLQEHYRRCQDLGIKIVDPIGERSWGQSEFTVEDPAGNFLSFWKQTE